MIGHQSAVKEDTCVWEGRLQPKCFFLVFIVKTHQRMRER